MDIDNIHAQTLRDTLLSIPEVVDIVGDRIFWLHVDDDEVLPYIVTSPITGGEDSEFVKSQASDVVWEVVGNTADIHTAVALVDAIGELRRMMPVTDNVPAVGHTYLTKVMAIQRRKGVQNNPIFEVGGLFRLRLSLD